MTINQYPITKGTETIPLIPTPNEQLRMRKTIRLLGIEACDRYTKKGYTPMDLPKHQGRAAILCVRVVRESGIKNAVERFSNGYDIAPLCSGIGVLSRLI